MHYYQRKNHLKKCISARIEIEGFTSIRIPRREMTVGTGRQPNNTTLFFEEEILQLLDPEPSFFPVCEAKPTFQVIAFQLRAVRVSSSHINLFEPWFVPFWDRREKRDLKSCECVVADAINHLSILRGRDLNRSRLGAPRYHRRDVEVVATQTILWRDGF